MKPDLKTYLGQTVMVRMDRQLGTKHPKYDWTYPVNYGFIPGTISGDGMEIDAYIIGVKEPLSEFTGTCLAVIERKNDKEDKLVVAPPDYRATSEEIFQAVEFQEKYYQSEVVQ